MAHPLLFPILRWMVLGAAASIGWRLASYAADKVNEDDWITDGLQDTLRDLKHTWSGRSDPREPE
jgi:hypothetical protein